ncbi:pseudouridine synthase deg1 [Thecaphora frezii]
MPFFTARLPHSPLSQLALLIAFRPRPSSIRPPRPVPSLDRRSNSTAPPPVDLRSLRHKMEAQERYDSWSKPSLISRIAELEAQTSQLRAAVQSGSTSFGADPSPASVVDEQQPPSSATASKKRIRPAKKDKKPREFDVASHPCRKIALRFSYEGSGYSGLAAQNGPQGAASPLPTVEAVLWEALVTARLVDPKAGMEGAGWSRCGRTDRGVSAAGQVVALWVRSKKVDQWHLRRQQEKLKEEAIARKADKAPDAAAEIEADLVTTSGAAAAAEAAKKNGERARKLESEELPYVSTLNRILPPSIRVQAWSPVRPDFSARFDCTYRHYKYFFTAGPSPLLFPATAEGADEARAKRLDIGAMREAASRLLGEHDFRNLCKVDASKQITNYRRRIDGVGIDLVSKGWPPSSTVRPSDTEVSEHDEPLYVFNLRGTAFLYHQVRNIMAILFLVGARLEKPQIIEELMNVERGEIARDRIKMKLAAVKGVKETANSEEPTAAAEGEAGKGGEAGLKWWLPVNGTASASTHKEWGRPQWMDLALSFPDDASASAEADDLAVFATKPNYEMASDRPLMLWECGFLPSDISWRAGTYDGWIPEDDGGTTVAAAGEWSARVASSTIEDLHTLWAQMTIKTELQRHFMLASASPRTGRLDCRTEFDKARWPTLEEGEANVVATRDGTKACANGTRRQGSVSLGYGVERGALNYVPLEKRTREESFVEKNRKWLETTGKRRAERDLAKAADE